MKVLKKGTGESHPRRYDRVRVQYTGWRQSGEMFDSRLAVVSVNELIPGWAEAIEKMVAGEKSRLWIPARLAYGDRPPPKLPAGDLTFEVELREIIPRPQPPMELREPPPSAKRTKSGLAYAVLKRGTGKQRPRPTDRVRVEYTGWLPDGRIFDGSAARGRSSTLSVGSGIAGFTEAAQLMQVGERTLFWIPGKLAYGDKPQHGVPHGTLIFDIELLEILR
jgi:FKBP-type peptidyl-prolyl cis-trans isomerase